MNNVMSFQAMKKQKSVKTLPLMNTDLKKQNAYHRSTRIVADQEN